MHTKEIGQHTDIGETSSTKVRPYSLFIAWPGKMRMCLAVIIVVFSVYKWILAWNPTSGYWLCGISIFLLVLFVWWQGVHITTLFWMTIRLAMRNFHRNFYRRKSVKHTENIFDAQNDHHLSEQDNQSNSRYEHYGVVHCSRGEVLATVVLSLAKPVTDNDQLFPWDVVVSFLYRFGVRARSIKVMSVDCRDKDAYRREFFISLCIPLLDNWDRVRAVKIFADDNSCSQPESEKFSERFENGSSMGDTVAYWNNIHKLVRLSENTMRRLQESLQQCGWICHLVGRDALPRIINTENIVHERLSYAEADDGVYTIYALTPARLAETIPAMVNFPYKKVCTLVDLRPSQYLSEHSQLSFSTATSSDDIYVSAACFINSQKPLPRRNLLPGMFKVRGKLCYASDIFSLIRVRDLEYSKKMTINALRNISWKY